MVYTTTVKKGIHGTPSPNWNDIVHVDFWNAELVFGTQDPNFFRVCCFRNVSEVRLRSTIERYTERMKGGFLPPKFLELQLRDIYIPNFCLMECLEQCGPCFCEHCEHQTDHGTRNCPYVNHQFDDMDEDGSLSMQESHLIFQAPDSSFATISDIENQNRHQYQALRSCSRVLFVNECADIPSTIEFQQV